MEWETISLVSLTALQGQPYKMGPHPGTKCGYLNQEVPAMAIINQSLLICELEKTGIE